MVLTTVGDSLTWLRLSLGFGAASALECRAKGERALPTAGVGTRGGRAAPARAAARAALRPDPRVPKPSALGL